MSPSGTGGRPPWVSLRMLKIVGVVLPIAFVLLLEVARFTVVEDDLAREGDTGEIFGHAALAAITVVCVVAFASVMFYFINRAQDQVLRQNRQLVAVTGVSTAVRDDLGVEQIVDRALDSVLASSGAVAASISVIGRECVRRDRSGRDELPVGRSAIDLALAAGGTSVGTLRLYHPSGQDRVDGLAADTLQTIGQQVAHAIQRAQLVADLTRGRDEGHAFYEVLLQISNRGPLRCTLQDVVRLARDRLGADRAILHLSEAASRIVLLEEGPDAPALPASGTVVLTPDGLEVAAARGDVVGTDLARRLAVPVGPIGAAQGELWAGRRSGPGFAERDRRFLVTLAELSAIALAGARVRENERRGAIVAERERIARELHDSLAQVLGVTHLRLHALRARPAVRVLEEVDAELADLATICREAYRDVREAILGLGQSSRTDRCLLDGLRAYLDAFTRQARIETRLEAACDDDLVLLPRCEVQIIRIIQEALTNVRKHSGARSAVVRVTARPSGLRFEVEDDGDGFEPGDVGCGRDGFGFGMYSMGERAGLVGGALQVDSSPGRGTRVRVDVPAALVQPRPAARGAGLPLVDLTTGLPGEEFTIDLNHHSAGSRGT